MKVKRRDSRLRCLVEVAAHHVFGSCLWTGRGERAGVLHAWLPSPSSPLQIFVLPLGLLMSSSCALCQQLLLKLCFQRKQGKRKLRRVMERQPWFCSVCLSTYLYKQYRYRRDKCKAFPASFPLHLILVFSYSNMTRKESKNRFLLCKRLSKEKPSPRGKTRLNFPAVEKANSYAGMD